MANHGTLVISPPIGVHSLTPNLRSNGVTAGWYNALTNLSTDAALIAGIANPNPQALVCRIANGSGNVTFRAEFVWDAASLIFSLDGNSPIAFSALPPGFFLGVILKGFLSSPVCGSTTYSARVELDNSISLAGVTTSAIDFTQLISPGLPVPAINSFITPSTFLDQTLAYQLIIDTSICPGTAVTNYPVINSYSLIGTYFIYQYDWTISLPGGSPVHVGDRIILTANMHGGNLGYHDFTDVTRIQFSYPIGGIARIIEVWKNGSVYEAYGGDDAIDLGGYPVSYINDPSTAPDPPQFTNDYGPYVINWEPETITIIIPFGFGDYGGPITVAGHVDESPVDDPDNPIPFTGSVPLAPITISFADTSGIYNITRGKKTDTLYNSARDGTTVEVAIPKPFAKTGFING